jgi:hypothetical protein
MERTRRLKTVAVGRDAPHRIHRHWATDHLVVLVAPDIGPGDRQFDRLLKRNSSHLERDELDIGRGHPAARRYRLRRPGLIEITLGDTRHDGVHLPAVDLKGTKERRLSPRAHRSSLARRLIEEQGFAFARAVFKTAIGPGPAAQECVFLRAQRASFRHTAAGIP